MGFEIPPDDDMSDNEDFTFEDDNLDSTVNAHSNNTHIVENSKTDEKVNETSENENIDGLIYPKELLIKNSKSYNFTDFKDLKIFKMLENGKDNLSNKNLKDLIDSSLDSDIEKFSKYSATTMLGNIFELFKLDENNKCRDMDFFLSKNRVNRQLNIFLESLHSEDKIKICKPISIKDEDLTILLSQSQNFINDMYFVLEPLFENKINMEAINIYRDSIKESEISPSLFYGV